MGGRVRDFFEWRLALGFTETGHRIAQAAHDTLPAKNNHGIEERRRHSWPTIATRVALISSPALTPPASATPREARSQAS